MAEEAAILGRVTFRERYVVLVVAFLAEFLGSFFPFGFDDVMVLTMVVIVRYATGRFWWRLPKKS